MKILFFGDIVGKTGRRAIAKILPKLKDEFRPDLVMANAENIAHGKGATLATLTALIEAGIDFFTSGNHVFDKPEGKDVFEKYFDKIIRPANFEGKLSDGSDLPGKGFVVIHIKKKPVLLINLNGQVFMEKQYDFGKITNPFVKLDEILSQAGGMAKIKILDFHAEATSEKRGMGFWADGRLSAVLGTHTHVATQDAQILPNGTGYQTDLGMVGARDSVIGVDKERALKRLLAGPGSQEKISLEVADSSQYEAGCVFLEIDEDTGKCENIVSRVEYL
ncbi:MAG: YmdB family metallophosphoesterase [Candidatus Doudnabacteria bacterium]|nr:YmdB family metallophosphoesterase [Candidatus Doudnabacteria bacterium]